MCQELFGSNYHCKVLLSLPSRKLISVILELSEHFIRHKEMYAILVIRLKQSKCLHLIQTRYKVWRFNTQTILDIFFPLSCSWVSEVSIENLNWCFHSDFKLSRNFRTSNLHLKDFSLMHDVLLIVGFNILPKNEAIPCKWYKGG